MQAEGSASHRFSDWFLYSPHPVEVSLSIYYNLHFLSSKLYWRTHDIVKDSNVRLLLPAKDHEMNIHKNLVNFSSNLVILLFSSSDEMHSHKAMKKAY